MVSAGSEQQRELWEQAGQALGRGDYRTARKLQLEVAALGQESLLGREATADEAKLRVDAAGIYGGLGFGMLYLLAWAVTLWRG